MYLVTIGDIGVTQTQIVTYGGVAAVAGSQWTVTDHSTRSSRVPTYALVLALVFVIACLLGLLFLLIKKHVYGGYVEVTVRADELTYTTRIPVSDGQLVDQTEAAVAYARLLAMNAPAS